MMISILSTLVVFLGLLSAADVLALIAVAIIDQMHGRSLSSVFFIAYRVKFILYILFIMLYLGIR